ncbi:MAG: carboxylesterase family protein [Parasphingorhabdus sp.]|nr:carboxylesterase family protein [Sphingorhabdus sp. YGSMI21]
MKPTFRSPIFIIISALFSLTTASAAARAADVPHATSEQGRLAGATDGLVERFLNIPYAAAPTGPLRWRAPQAAPGWRGVRDASVIGPACPQTVRPPLIAGGIAEKQSEDCLQLNIWRPKGARDLPVMVWMHGGAHVIGSGTFPVFDGSAFAQQGVILVTINYRLGPLGYFAHPALTAASPQEEAIGNYGLMDQLATLRWVQANIASFGGDPQQVTLFGESAGAIALSTILANREAKGLFARAIVQSGVGLTDLRILADEEKRGLAFAESAGALASASADDLRALPVAALVAAGKTRAPGAMIGPFIDGKLVRESPWRTMARAEPVDVPLMVGANSNEASVILAMGVPPAAALAFLGEDTGVGRAAYGAGLADDELARQVLGDAWFVAPARWLAGRTQHGAPSYLYHFDYVAEGRRDRVQGAAHGSEIPYVFGTLDYLASLTGSVSAADRRFSAELSSCWVAFAKSGVPRCSLTPDWPRYDAATDHLALLATTTHVVSKFRKPQLDHLLKVHAEQARAVH